METGNLTLVGHALTVEAVSSSGATSMLLDVSVDSHEQAKKVFYALLDGFADPNIRIENINCSGEVNVFGACGSAEYVYTDADIVERGQINAYLKPIAL